MPEEGMSNIRSYRDLEAWQSAMDLADLVYTITDKFPRSERFGLVFQMRKACVSIPSNIAEGSRHRLPGYISRVIIALGEHAELETQALIGQRRKYIDERDMAAFNESRPGHSWTVAIVAVKPRVQTDD